jgi:hypothetical protein
VRLWVVESRLSEGTAGVAVTPFRSRRIAIVGAHAAISRNLHMGLCIAVVEDCGKPLKM